jgi:hypothetical protein
VAGVGQKSLLLVATLSPASPPSIVAPPQNLNAFANSNVKFTTVATGSLPLGYRWFTNSTATPLSNGGQITGATNSALTISNATLANAGSYFVVVTNLYGAATSSVANLTITSPSGAYQTAVLANSPAPFAYYSFSETNDPSTGTAVANDSIGNFNGTYGVASLNGFNGIAGPRTTPDGLTGFPNSNTALGTSNLNSYASLPAFNLNNGVGTNVLTITAWIHPNGVEPNAAGVVFCRNGSSTVAGIAYLDNNPNNYLGYNWNNNSATYNWSSGIVPPTNVWSLVALVVTPTNATLYVCNSNGLSFAVNNVTNAIQKFDGPTFVGYESFATTRIFNGSIDEVGLFGQALTQSQITNLFSAGSGTTAGGFRPVIEGNPAWTPTNSLYVGGQSASITIAANGTPPLSYQWLAGAVGSGVYTNLVNGGGTAGATSATLSITNAQLANDLDYVVVVANSFGSVTSSVPATLTVNDSSPFVVTDITPRAATAYVGSTATFTATFDGSRPISYQWVADNNGDGNFVNIPGATNSTLVISNLPAGLSGQEYYVVASNFANGQSNSAPSSVATLTTYDPAYMIHFSSTNAITTADAVLNQPGVLIGAEVFGTNAEVVTLSNGTNVTFKADGSVASVTPGNTGAFAYPAPNTTGNANFDAVLNQCSADLGPKTITVNNLVAGHKYSVLLIGLDARGLPINGGAPARFAYFQDPHDLTVVSPTFQMGQNVYLMASFLAQTTTQNIIEQLPTGNNGDMNTLVVYDVTSVVTVPTLSLAHSGGTLTLTWSAGSTLLQATNLLGPWTTNTATSPYTVPTTNAQSFFRVRIP